METDFRNFLLTDSQGKCLFICDRNFNLTSQLHYNTTLQNLSAEDNHSVFAPIIVINFLHET